MSEVPLHGGQYTMESVERNLVYVETFGSRKEISSGFEMMFSNHLSRGHSDGMPGFGFRDSGFGFRVSGFGIRISGFRCRVSGFRFRISNFVFRI